MKKFLFSCAFLMIACLTFAQTAPDFTVTDTHGNEHNLFEDYLDNNQVVILDLMFVNCPPCNDLAPDLEAYYQELLAINAPVQIISLTSDPDDTNPIMLGFEEQHGLNFPAVSADGGGVEAQQPYTTGTYGQFFGYPTLVVIDPMRGVQFDPWGSSDAETIQILDGYVQTALLNVNPAPTGVEDLDIASDISVYPNPATTDLNVSLEGFDAEVTIEVYNVLGKRVSSFITNKQTEVMNIATLSAGNYLLLATDGTLTSREKFTVTK